MHDGHDAAQRIFFWPQKLYLHCKTEKKLSSNIINSNHCMVTMQLAIYTQFSIEKTQVHMQKAYVCNLQAYTPLKHKHYSTLLNS